MTLGNLENVPAAGRVRFFLEHWKKLTNNLFILKVVQGYQIPLLSEPTQFSFPTGGTDSCISGKTKIVGKKSIKISATVKRPGSQYTLPSCQKSTGHPPVINLKMFNWCISCDHFKMKGLFFLKKMFPEERLRVKDAYFAVSLHSCFQQYIRFKWKGNVYQFLCLCLA